MIFLNLIFVCIKLYSVWSCVTSVFTVDLKINLGIFMSKFLWKLRKIRDISCEFMG